MPSPQRNGYLAVEWSEFQQAYSEGTGIYPVLTLPPEIVSEIFLKFLPIYPGIPPLSGVLSPLLLCRICRQWREIALSTPALWNTIRMDITRPWDDDKAAAQLELVRAWLSRSGDYPLSITLTDSSNSPLAVQFLHAAVFHCGRWEHVDLFIPFEHLHLIQGNMPLLRDLTIGPNDLPDRHGLQVSVFDRAPLLTNVVLTHDFVPYAIRLPWAQLTHLVGLCLFEHECTEILGHAVQLVHGTFSIFSYTGPYRPLPHPITLPSLCQLILDGSDIGGGDPMKVLDNFALPGLRTLHVYGVRYRSLATFIRRSQCALEELQINNQTLSEEEYQEAFQNHLL
ncbi:hypothetical protein C8F04DRAFT_324968 [Mycena alexandri]|uniref:F-box domain-containing protein n=1 Tax=Mycena alexandri TaxID=1745969 RepID=A0AAD6S263_9AGAR|nr:hypothetical protein C8F04DRAFT_324968 [Mycena alexandri]